MDFGTNKRPAEIIKEGAFGGTYFGKIYCIVKVERYRNSRKEFDESKNIDKKCYCSNYYDININI